MRRSNIDRLRIVERHLSKGDAKPPSPWRAILRAVVAFRLGSLTEEEAIAEGYSRALGYPSPSQFKRALRSSPGEVAERHNAAVQRLSEGEATGPEHDEAEKREGWAQNLPEWIQARLPAAPLKQNLEAEKENRHG